MVLNASVTLERYETSLKHTLDFVLYKYNFKNINIERIDHSFVTEYDFYLRSERKCAYNTWLNTLKVFIK
uniref:phage integrase SAM-like domain-containing protein n=1 Tax=Flavobacterium sp. TaxID=239 RepID=UPI0040488C10